MNPRQIFLILTIAATLCVGWVDINYYPQLSQGDHGRDLYAAQEILRGKVPYKDFWWVYGPLMPYYYAIFYKLGGGSIGSFLFGKLLLKTACAAFFYLAASAVMFPSIAFLGAMWFVLSQQDFFFTFNHIGGIAMQLWILFMLFSYIQRRSLRFLWLALPAIFIYGLIKINFGLAALVAAALTIAGADFIDKNPFTNGKKKLYFSLFVIIPAAWIAVYWFLLKDLPPYAIHQCMPYFGDDQPHHYPPSVTIPYYFTQHWLTFYHHWLGFQNMWNALGHAGEIHSPVQWIMVFFNLFILPMDIIIHGSTIAALFLMCQRRLSDSEIRSFWLALLCLLTFFVLNFHEFVVSGVWYRTFWSLPFLFMFHFVMMSTAFRVLPALVRRLIWTIMGILIGIGFLGSVFSTQQQKTLQHFLNGPRGGVYIGNEPQWTETVNAVSAFLNKNLKPTEQFFALPYDCIYYYLTGRESPTRQLIFFDHIKIPLAQEQEIIRELQSKNVTYVLMSNRIMSSETGLGIFGKTYCPLISRYIEQNYAPFARQGGDWQAEPGWGNNHGVMILKKK